MMGSVFVNYKTVAKLRSEWYWSVWCMHANTETTKKSVCFTFVKSDVVKIFVVVEIPYVFHKSPLHEPHLLMLEFFLLIVKKPHMFMSFIVSDPLILVK